MVSPTKPDEGHVLFWITEEDGREFATCAAATFRAAMTERDELRAENETWRETVKQYREEIDREHAENERLRALIDKHDEECRECPVIGI
jgi:multidrug resistance efflux pump